MSMIAATCPTCQHQLQCAPSTGGRNVMCPRCKTPVRVPGQPVPVAGPPAPIVALPAEPLRVVVVDLRMPFPSIVGLMVKVTLAAIPAAIILAVIFIVASLVFMWLTGIHPAAFDPIAPKP